MQKKLTGISSAGSTFSKRSISIGSDVWIGTGVAILSGVTIGDGAVIGANSVVLEDVPPYTICGGNPCKVIKERFSSEIVDELEKIKWYEEDIADLKKIEDLIENNIDMEVISKLKERLGL